MRTNGSHAGRVGQVSTTVNSVQHEKWIQFEMDEGFYSCWTSCKIECAVEKRCSWYSNIWKPPQSSFIVGPQIFDESLGPLNHKWYQSNSFVFDIMKTRTHKSIPYFSSLNQWLLHFNKKLLFDHLNNGQFAYYFLFQLHLLVNFFVNSSLYYFATKITSLVFSLTGVFVDFTMYWSKNGVVIIIWCPSLSDAF